MNVRRIFAKPQLAGLRALLALSAIIALFVFCPKAPGQWVNVDGDGTGVFVPGSGLFYGTGDGSLLGRRYFSGLVEVEQLDPTDLTKPLEFKNAGRGTRDEKFQEIITTDGSSLSFRFIGTVQLAPIVTDAGQQFTATWRGDFQIVKGTGRFKGAIGSFDVVATNKPFNLTDAAWKFDWTWQGRMRLKRNALSSYSILTTEGFGAFDPANLGVGTVEPFPLIIGDGSGLAIYDGTPTGDNHRLDGILVASGDDQHFGTAQSLTLGIETVPGLKFEYPGTDGNQGTDIHRMVTDIGELWLQKDYYFELDLEQGTLVAPVDFRVIGGTGLYSGAKGSIFCFVDIDLPVVDPTAEPVVAPFHYDFDGYVELKPINRIILSILQWFWQWQG